MAFARDRGHDRRCPVFPLRDASGARNSTAQSALPPLWQAVGRMLVRHHGAACVSSVLSNVLCDFMHAHNMLVPRPHWHAACACLSRCSLAELLPPARCSGRAAAGCGHCCSLTFVGSCIACGGPVLCNRAWGGACWHGGRVLACRNTAARHMCVASSCSISLHSCRGVNRDTRGGCLLHTRATQFACTSSTRPAATLAMLHHTLIYS